MEEGPLVMQTPKTGGGVRGARKFTEGESVFIVSSASGFTGGTRAVGMSGVGISSSS